MGKNVVVDDEDAGLLDRIRWRIAPNGYVYATVYLHRIVMKAPLDRQVDHKDRDKTNNRKSNLRIVTAAENLAHRHMFDRKAPRKAKGVHSSRYLGVCWHKKLKKWRATFRRQHLGLFTTESEAFKAYTIAATAYYAT